jgi:formyltetrahydrofolate-dependent phosphoribosylglycinamide formyltransferase
MFEKLKNRWKVSGVRFVLIIATFAIGGSLTGYVARKLMLFLHIYNPVIWTIIYILLVSLLWPLAVIVVSIPFGQFSFFKHYLSRMGARMGLGKDQNIKNKRQINIAIFASGAGSNAKKIIEHFRDHPSIKIALIVCNKPGAGVLSIAAENNIPVLLIEKERFFRGDAYVDELKKHKTTFIVLAGFLWKIPSALIRSFSGKIINIHPALLPSYGGKGMYGHFVHEAVINNKEKQSGISIHYVDELYDHGPIIFQATCPVMENDTTDDLAQRIHELEHQHYPRVIEEVVSGHTSAITA